MSYKAAPAPTRPADIITYRHDQKLVYVRPADSYEGALDIAQKEYPELAYAERDLIAFAVTSTFPKGERCRIRISESAWPSAVPRLLRGEIIDVYLRSDTHSQRAQDSSPPPQYLEVPKKHYQEPSKTSEKKSTAGSKSAPSSRGPSPSLENRRSWFGNNIR